MTERTGCPHCGKPSTYVTEADRYYHDDGSDHAECWLRMVQGRPPLPAKGTDLYRFFDEFDTLLYIGISLSAIQRASEHRSDKAWWPHVRRMEVQHLDCDRREAERVEREAIIAERPLHNIAHNVIKTIIHKPSDDVVAFDATMIIGTNDVALYNEVGTALDAIAKRLDGRARSDDEQVGTRQDFIDVIGGLVRSLVYGDCCDHCMEVRFPMALKITEKGWARCAYFCHTCDYKWGCNWTVDLALLASIG